MDTKEFKNAAMDALYARALASFKSENPSTAPAVPGSAESDGQTTPEPACKPTEETKKKSTCCSCLPLVPFIVYSLMMAFIIVWAVSHKPAACCKTVADPAQTTMAATPPASSPCASCDHGSVTCPSTAQFPGDITPCSPIAAPSPCASCDRGSVPGPSCGHATGAPAISRPPMPFPPHAHCAMAPKEAPAPQTSATSILLIAAMFLMTLACIFTTAYLLQYKRLCHEQQMEIDKANEKKKPAESKTIAQTAVERIQAKVIEEIVNDTVKAFKE